MEEEEELLKRFTDCVYFLASPLTCKKGILCEYRHSEIARLNPRDCWFWLGGCCFHPECAFRHPPLEGLKEAYHESFKSNKGLALPVEKTKVPCYFYSKGFCSKGEQCSFLHGLPDGLKLAKAWSTVNNADPPDQKLSARSNIGSTPVENHPNLSETAQVAQTQQLSSGAQVAQTQQLSSGSAEIIGSLEENVVSSDSLVPPEDIVLSESDFCNSQDSDQQADAYVEEEGWLEASPGFDVLVEGKPERLVYEEDQGGYFSVHYDERKELDALYADPIEYNSPIEKRDDPLKEERYDPLEVKKFDQPKEKRYDPLKEKRYAVFDRLKEKISGQSRGHIFYRLSFQKRNAHMEPIFNNRRRGSDLRDHLKRHEVVDFKRYGFDQKIRRYPQRHLSRCEIDFDQRIRRYSHRHVFRGENNFDHRGRLWKTVPVNAYWQPFKKPRFLYSEVARSRKPALQPRRSREESAIFTGPKTLDQIKEEKMKAVHKRDLGSSTRTGSDGFQGPRPLSEILKDKRKLG
uniref:zinc finger CCCH domain-containing protein 17-like n=1 Tax=Erigeron canadensis TaxID=72917 RepID=UPI001CB97E02|nr:zinc finger CCCH domain-containing protein 17-like [Erigeron canadensis]